MSEQIGFLANGEPILNYALDGKLNPAEEALLRTAGLRTGATGSVKPPELLAVSVGPQRMINAYLREMDSTLSNV